MMINIFDSFLSNSITHKQKKKNLNFFQKTLKSYFHGPYFLLLISPEKRFEYKILASIAEQIVFLYLWNPPNDNDDYQTKIDQMIKSFIKMNFKKTTRKTQRQKTNCLFWLLFDSLNSFSIQKQKKNLPFLSSSSSWHNGHCPPPLFWPFLVPKQQRQNIILSFFCDFFFLIISKSKFKNHMKKKKKIVSLLWSSST